MSTCAACGHELGVGRFCNNCGHPADGPAPATPEEEWRTDTAERTGLQRPPPPPPPPAAARVPPTAVASPPPPRYPLFADEVTVDANVVAAPETAASMIEEPEPHEEWEPDEDERRSVLTWVAVVLLVALVAVGGYLGWQYFTDDPDSSSPDPQASDGSPTGNGEPAPVDLSLTATAVAPETAPPSEDVNGELVSFDASNMLDGVPETAWRAPGDAKGMELKFRLAKRTTLTSVGMINGYDKRSKDAEGRTFDWYRGNRRVEAVIWDFGEGTKVRQTFEDDRAMQSIEFPAVSTRKITVRLVRVSEPGEGRSARDFTAISEVSLLGPPS